MTDTDQLSLFNTDDNGHEPPAATLPAVGPAALMPHSEQPQGEPQQEALFDPGKPWHDHWRGMPEFVQDSAEPFKTLYVHFETREDMDAFARLVNQRVTRLTRSIWYPEVTIETYANKRWVDQLPPARLDELDGTNIDTLLNDNG